MNALLQSIYSAFVIPILWILFGAAILTLVWGLIECIRNSDSDDGRATCKKHILWGIIGLFVMASVFGLVQIVADTLGVDNPTRDVTGIG